jgi:hypothetical protein
MLFQAIKALKSLQLLQMIVILIQNWLNIIFKIQLFRLKLVWVLKENVFIIVWVACAPTESTIRS